MMDAPHYPQPHVSIIFTFEKQLPYFLVNKGFLFYTVLAWKIVIYLFILLVFRLFWGWGSTHPSLLTSGSYTRPDHGSPSLLLIRPTDNSSMSQLLLFYKKSFLMFSVTHFYWLKWGIFSPQNSIETRKKISRDWRVEKKKIFNHRKH